MERLKLWFNNLAWRWRCWRNPPRMWRVFVVLAGHIEANQKYWVPHKVREIQWSWTGFIVADRIVQVWPRPGITFAATSKTRLWGEINA